MADPIRGLSRTPRSHTRSKQRLQDLKQRSQLRQREENFVLDCLNRQKSQPKPYSPSADPFLKYTVVRVAPKTRIRRKRRKRSCQQIERENHQNFQWMLHSYRQKLTQGTELPVIPETVDSSNSHKAMKPVDAQQRKLLSEIKNIIRYKTATGRSSDRIPLRGRQWQM